jgi:cell wall-associated NlpC family hydrolase
VPSGGSGGLSGTLSCTGLARLWLAAGGSAAHVLVAAEVAMAESGGNQYAHSPTNDFGYWQINGSHGAMASYDPMTNARAAISVSGDGSNWSPWTTYTSGAYAGKCPAASVSAASRIGVPAPVASAPGSSLEVRAMRLAESKIGDPYVYGAEGPDKFDCSGLVTWAYHQLGATRVGRTTGDLWNEGPHVSRASLQPGDLLFFDSIGHVGIYTGNGQMVVAPHTGDYVKIQAVYWAGYDGAVRIA